MPNNTIPDLIPVPAGRFWLGGSPNDPAAEDNEKPLHEIELPDFSISKYPITNAQYAEFVQSTKHSAPLHWGGNNPPDSLLNHPVVNISIVEAMSYCEWLSQQTDAEYRLPSEMEWEKAARGTRDDRPYVWGSAWKPDSCNTLEMGIGSTTAVTHFEHTNYSPFGAIDMLGNVWEWTKSYYLGFPGSPHETFRYGDSYHVIRGGSWHHDRRLARVSCRGRYLLGIRRPYLGFRIVLKPFNHVKIKNQLLKYFNIKELRDLCFDLEIDHELFPTEKDEFIRELILHSKRHKCMLGLITQLRKSRSNVDW